jgi:hypothetical protein
MKPSNRSMRRTISAAILVAGFCVAGALTSAGAQDQPQNRPEVGSALQAPSGDVNARLRENSYYYSAFNRRDPFRSLVTGQFIRDDMMETIDLTGVELVGIVKGDLDRFALLEDEKGFTYILRVGDRVRSGSVVAIGEQSMTARIVTFGQTSKFTLHLVERQKGDKR